MNVPITTLPFFRQVLVCTAAVLAVACAPAQPPPGYYSMAEGLTGQPLRQALHNIIDDHTVLSYDNLWDAYATTDAKPGNKVWDMYSDVPGGTPPYVYTLFSDQCGSYNSEADCYNREHSFPQSWFNDGNPMRTDLFHVYPTDGWVNNKRGNLPYGEVGSADWTSQNGSKTGLCVSPGYNGTVFEPIDEYKGDLARTYFYMMTRYYGEMGGWSSPMLAGGDLSLWAKNLLLTWHDQDPVSAKETARNNAVFALQDNRNPYIDQPGWVHAIWGSTLGLEEQTPSDLRIHADPSGLIVDCGPAPTTAFTIRDLAGRVVLSMRIDQGRNPVAFRAAPGVYIAEVATARGRAAQRFLW